MTVPYRLGIDIGTNSLGWCVLDLSREREPKGIRRIGARIFSNGRAPDDTPLAVERRGARGARKRRDRFVDRQKNLMAALIRHGLMPSDTKARKELEGLDPYELRAKGLGSILPAHHLGRAIFHLNQRRGFKSNRKTDRKQKKDDIKGMKGAIINLRQAISDSGACTLGEYLFNTFRKDRTVRGSQDGSVMPHGTLRARPHVVKSKNEYDLYADRAMYEQEFDMLWQCQKELGLELSDAARDEIREIIFFQRDLKPVKPGKCALDPSDERAPLALPLVQRFRMLSELANLEIIFPDQTRQPLTLDERNKILKDLQPTKELSFEKKIRAKLGLGTEVTFNLADIKRKGLKGDLTGIELSGKDCFGSVWWTFTLDRQNEIVEYLLDEASEEKVIAKAVQDWGLSQEAAANVADASLPDGYGRLGRKALSKIVPIMEAGVVKYHEAAAQAGYDHARQSDGEVFDQLPYYGEILQHTVTGTGKIEDREHPEKFYGRIPNPTVHVALNELRKVVNALSKKYGPPCEIVVEIARDLPLGQEAKSKKNKEQADNQKKNDERRKELAGLGLAENGENLLRLRLWEELDKDPLARRCVYTGEVISISRLFGPEVEIEHILPFRRTLDNSPANKTVSMRSANRYKGNRSPHEAFGDSRDGFDWESILLRATALPKNKRWRFSADAMSKFEGQGDFLARQLVDTQYISKLTREYLAKLTDPNKVWVITGRLTEMLRGKWGLNSLLSGHNRKNRFDHRHHAIDAFVAGVTDRSMLQRVASASDQFRERLIDDMPDPWDGFRDELAGRLEKIVISHKPDHGVQGKLHNDTAYGIVGTFNCVGTSNVIHRVPLSTLTEAKSLTAIKDDKLKDIFLSATNGLTDKDFQAALLAAGKSLSPPVMKVRLQENISVIPIAGSNGAPYKAFKGDSNYCYDIFLNEKNKWDGEIISRFEANKQGFDPKSKTSRSGVPLVMRLRIDDLIAIQENGKRRIMRVVKMSKGKITLAEHFESGPLKARAADKDDYFDYLTRSPSSLQQMGTRQVFVDPIGQINDPGPPK